MTVIDRMERKTSASKIVKILGSESNVHGISKIAKARSAKRGIFWTVLVVLALTAAILQLAFLLKKYFSYPIVEVSNKSRNLHVPFPAVTLCNTNAISMVKVNKQLENSDLVPWFQFIQDTNFGEHDSKLDSHQAFYENLPEDAIEIAHSFDDMVLSCRFKNADCGIKNFSLHFDGKNYYNCFTFTVHNEKQTKENLLPNNAGSDEGLSLILSLGKDSFPPGSYGIYDIKNPLGFSGGMRVHIHPRNTMPTPFYHGLDIPPGYSTSVGLQTKIYSRLPHPYGDCTTKSSKGRQKYKNTVFTCLQQCQQKILTETCGCKTSALPEFDSLDPKVPFCLKIKNWKNKSRPYNGKDQVELKSVSCEQKVMEHLSNDRSYENNCGCPEHCKEMTYEHSVSMSYWPEEFYQLAFLEELFNNTEKPTELVQEALDILNNTISKYGELARQGNMENFDRSDKIDLARASTIIRQNFIRLNIYLQDSRVTEHIQMPAYDLTSLLADIGGTLILWMGISVLTIMEVFELIMALMLLACNSDEYVMGDKRGKNKREERQEIS